MTLTNSSCTISHQVTQSVVLKQNLYCRLKKEVKEWWVLLKRGLIQYIRTANFFDPITKWKWEGLSNSAIKLTITDNRKIHNIIVARYVLGTLVAASFLLGAVSQPLTADNKKRKTNKSKLYDAVETAYQNFIEFTKRAKQYLIFDFAVTLHSMIVTPTKLKELTIKLLNDISQQYDSLCYMWYI